MGFEERVNTVISEQIGVSLKSFTHQSSLLVDLQADELDIVELTMALEEEFGIEISDEEMENCKLVSDIHNLVYQRINMKAGVSSSSKSTPSSAPTFSYIPPSEVSVECVCTYYKLKYNNKSISVEVLANGRLKITPLDKEDHFTFNTSTPEMVSDIAKLLFKAAQLGNIR